MGLLLSASAAGQTWHFEPWVGSEFTLTDNVNLDSREARKGDFITQITPGLRFDEKSAHTSVAGSVLVPVLLYARTGGENNDVRPAADITGNAELIPRLFYIDGSIQVSQEYFSPFGPRPENLSNATKNRYTAQSYRVSPYLRGEAADGLTYELRDTNTWTDESNVAFDAQRSYTNEVLANVTREARPVGWALSYERVDTRFNYQDPLQSEVERGRFVHRPDPQFEWSLLGGYENNNYAEVRNSGAVYGGGFRWRPTDRTNLDVSAEHRFFGPSYKVNFEHRTPLSVWTLHASRDVTTYPQQLANIGAGVDVNGLLNRLFTSRIPDPAQRQTIVDQLIRDRGLPAVLSSPLAVYTQQVTLLELLQATAGLLGARNAIFGTVYRSRTEPIASGVATELLFQNNNTQSGANLTWSYKVTTLYTLTSSADFIRTVDNESAGNEAKQLSFKLLLSVPISPLTNVYAGARWQRLDSNLSNDYRETAAFVGMTHMFR